MNWKKIKWNVPINEVFGLKSIRLFDERYESVISFSFGYQLVILLMAGMILDGGQCVQFVLVAMACFWGSAIVLISRRRWTPSKSDILYIKWGFFPILISVPFILEFAWKLRGLI